MAKFEAGHTPWHKGKRTGIVPSSAFKPGRVSPNKGKNLIPWEELSYSGRHGRIRRLYGRASDYLCESGCQGKAESWAMVHDRIGGQVFFDFVPLCYRCHTEYDAGVVNSAIARRGIALTPEHRAAVSAAQIGKKRGPYKKKVALCRPSPLTIRSISTPTTRQS